MFHRSATGFILFHHERFKCFNIALVLLTFMIRHRDQTLVGEVAVGAPGLVTGKFGQIVLDARHDAHVGFFDVEVQRTRNRIGAVGNVVEVGCTPSTIEPCILSVF